MKHVRMAASLLVAAALLADPAIAQTTGPGDPTTLYAPALGLPLGIAAGRAGELFVADTFRIDRVDPTGSVTTYFGGPTSGSFFIDVVVEGSGDLLVAGSVLRGQAWQASVDRITPSGQRSQFTQFAAADADARAITIGPDGDVWVGVVISSGASEIRRYDPLGTFRGAVAASPNGLGGVVVDLAFSPSGQLYYSGVNYAVYKIASGIPQLVFETPGLPGMGGLSFDKDGYLYVGHSFLGVVLLDPTGQVVSNPFATTNLGGSAINLAFLRAANGDMTARLLAAYQGGTPDQPGPGGIVEMNPAGMRANGFRIGAIASIATASAHLLGGLELDPIVQQQLDAQGNNNGKYDVGDFRAYLRANGQLSATTAAVRRERS